MMINEKEADPLPFKMLRPNRNYSAQKQYRDPFE